VKLYLIWLAAVSALLFTLMGVDKQRARRRQWRVSERTLLLLAALGGAAGGCLGMLFFRHKTRHKRFQLGFPLLLLCQLAILLWLWRLERS
jgi:uncharacterized membrane protein YsdA (DUF1294 family)